MPHWRPHLTDFARLTPSGGCKDEGKGEEGRRGGARAPVTRVQSTWREGAAMQYFFISCGIFLFVFLDL